MIFIERGSNGRILHVAPPPYPEATEQSDVLPPETSEWLEVKIYV